MLVKIQTFRKDSFHPTAVARSKYLLGDCRAIGGITTQNIMDDSRAFAEIDETRKRSGTRGSVTGRELVLSPSPDDAATPDEVRAFAQELLAEMFPDFEAAIVIHEDNKTRKEGEGIPHAHVYLGTIDLENGGKLNLSNDKVRELHDKAQDMSRARGWSAQPKYQKAAKKKKRLPRDRQAHFINGEYDAEDKGHPFVKTVIWRALEQIIKDMGEDPSLKLSDALESHGIVAEKAASGYKFRTVGGKQFFSAKSLGREYSLDSIRERVGELQRGQTAERPPERREGRGGSSGREGFERER